MSFPGLQPQSANIVLSSSPAERDFAMVLGFREEITVGSQPADHDRRRQSNEPDHPGARAVIQLPAPTSTDGTDSVRPATLRGLGSDQVLVLINGKRRR